MDPLISTSRENSLLWEKYADGEREKDVHLMLLCFLLGEKNFISVYGSLRNRDELAVGAQQNDVAS